MADNLALLKEMFQEMVVNKDAGLIPKYYDRDFQLFTNGSAQGYQEFLEEHDKIYQTEIQYAFRYDEETLVGAGDKVAGRIFITIMRPDESAKEIEIMLIAQYRAGKLLRIWELTYPDCSKLAAFDAYSI